MDVYCEGADISDDGTTISVEDMRVMRTRPEESTSKVLCDISVSWRGNEGFQCPGVIAFLSYRTQASCAVGLAATVRLPTLGV
jgi:hypothetical protein